MFLFSIIGIPFIGSIRAPVFRLHFFGERLLVSLVLARDVMESVLHEFMSWMNWPEIFSSRMGGELQEHRTFFVFSTDGREFFSGRFCSAGHRSFELDRVCEGLASE